MPSFGFVRATYWVRFTLAPSADSSLWFLEIAHPLHDKVTLYEESPEGLRKVARIGDRIPFDERRVKATTIVFEIATRQDKAKTYWISSRSESSMVFPLTLWKKDSFQSALTKDYAIKGFYYGMIAVMGLYNLVLFFVSRQAEYLKYVLYIWASTAFQMALTGVAFQFLWPENTWMANEGIALLAGFVCLFLVWFTQSFLDTQSYAPKLHKTLTAAKLASIVVIVFALAGPHRISIQMGNYLSLSTALIMLFVCTRSLQLKIPQARFFVLAFLAFFCGVILVVLKISGLLPANVLTVYGFQFGSALEVVLLSVAVGDKIRIERAQASQKIHAAHNEIANLNQSLQILNQDLERKVSEKTIDLQKKKVQIETILNSLPIGVATLDGHAQIVQHSKWMSQFFEMDTLVGEAILTILFDKTTLDPDTKDVIVKTISIMIGEEEFSFCLNEAHLPREILLRHANQEYVVELTWSIMLDEKGLIDKVLIALHNVTDIRSAREEAEKKSRDLTMLSEIVAFSSDRFEHFVTSTDMLLAEINSILKDTPDLARWKNMLRMIHTMKGNSRTCGLSLLNNLIHLIEAKLIAMDPGQHDPSRSRDVALDSCREIRSLMSEYEAMSAKIRERSEDVSKDKLLLQLHSWLDLLQKDSLWTKLPHPANAKEVLDALDQIWQVNPEDLFAPLVSSLGSIARQLHKQVPRVRFVNHENVRFRKDRMQWFESVFSHLFRNSLDHGFSEHQHGTITITIETLADKLRLIYTDDGRGLDLDTLARKYAAATSSSVPVSTAQLTEVFFDYSLSSKDQVSDISGRGLGMGAVKDMVTEAGGTLRIELRAAHAPPYVPFALIIELPQPSRRSQQLRAS